MMALSKDPGSRTNDFATKRDAYYQSKNWGEAKFDDQNESDTVMDDIEAMFSIQGVSREQLRYIPDEHGGAVAGELIVFDTGSGDRQDRERIDCTRFGSGAYSIPSLVEHLTFETRGRGSCCAWKPAACSSDSRATSSGSTRSASSISMAGVPTRATRRFVRQTVRSMRPAGLRVRRLRSVRCLEHLQNTQGRIRQRRAHQPVLLRAACIDSWE